MQSISIMRKADKTWVPLPLVEFTGQTIEQLFLTLEGVQAIVECDFDGKKAYICGTEQWLEHYRKKGRPAYTVTEALERLRLRSPQLLGERVEDPLGVAELFPGSSVEVVEFGS